MAAILAWFDGKKTAIGMVLLLLVQVGRIVAPQFEFVYAVIEKIALALGAVGVAHKLVK